MRYTVEHNANSETLFIHEERVDATNSADFKAELLIRCRSGIEVLFVDLGEVMYCDSGGLGAMLIAHREMKVSGGYAIFVGLSPHVEQIINLTKLDQALYIYPTREEALADLKASQEDDFDAD